MCLNRTKIDKNVDRFGFLNCYRLNISNGQVCINIINNEDYVYNVLKFYDDHELHNAHKALGSDRLKALWGHYIPLSCHCSCSKCELQLLEIRDYYGVYKNVTEDVI